jgi:hypothetical protein
MLVIRRGITSLIIVIPWALNTLSVLAALPAQDFRYLLASVFVSFFFIGLPFIRFDQKEKDVTS